MFTIRGCSGCVGEIRTHEGTNRTKKKESIISCGTKGLTCLGEEKLIHNNVVCVDFIRG